jgi:hypothetical protein
VNKQASKYIFTTEGHFLKLDKSMWKDDTDFYDMTRGYQYDVTAVPRSNVSDCGVSVVIVR